MSTVKLLLTLTLISGLSSFGSVEPQSDNSKVEDPIRLHRDKPQKGPRIPSKDYIDVTYDGNGFNFIPYYVTSEVFYVNTGLSGHSIQSSEPYGKSDYRIF